MPQINDNVDFDDNQSTLTAISDNFAHNDSQSSTFVLDENNEVETQSQEFNTDIIEEPQSSDNSDAPDNDATNTDSNFGKFAGISNELKTNLENLNTIFQLTENLKNTSPNLLNSLSDEYNSLKRKKKDLEKDLKRYKRNQDNLKTAISQSLSMNLDEQLISSVPQEAKDLFTKYIENAKNLETYHNLIGNLLQGKALDENLLNIIPENERDLFTHFVQLRDIDMSQNNVLMALLGGSEYNNDDFNKIKSGIQELINKYQELKNSLDAEREVVLQVLSSDDFNKEKSNLLTQELRNLIGDYIELRKKATSVDQTLESLRNDINKINVYIQDFGLKKQDHPQVASEFNPLLDSLDSALGKIEENSRVNLYSRISDAISKGTTDQLPKEMLDLINQLIIERLESIVKPYEELSSKYVSGQINHDEFTEFLRKNALLSLMREKIIEDIIREYENNNLASSIIPSRLKTATERMINDAKHLNSVITSDVSPTITVTDLSSATPVSNEGSSMSGAFFTT